jgi:pimeloyl-ACP methyl ester carboxylesterase
MVEQHGYGRVNSRRAFRLMPTLIVLLMTAIAVVSCGDDSSPSEVASPSKEAEASPVAQSSPVPSNTVWLCRPGLENNPCETDLTATLIAADGSKTTEPFGVDRDRPIDCFYVYPTVSGQETMNANLNIDPEQTAIAVQQAARFSPVCKVYAPIYRQLTLKAINTAGVDLTAARDLAYADVVAAWQDYLANHNDGRGVVLIGHSQGTGMLTRLTTEEIDPKPEVRRLLVSALLIGGAVTVTIGKDVGGDFQKIPACRTETQTGCVVAYSSFNQPPPADSRFGRPRKTSSGAEPPADVEVLCVNPASLSGGTGDLKPYFPTEPFPGVLGQLGGAPPPESTPWVAYPGLYTSRCESAEGANWLQIDTTGIAGDTRPVVAQTIGPTWGLHLYDMGLAMGNLVDLVRKQAAAYSE